MPGHRGMWGGGWATASCLGRKGLRPWPPVGDCGHKNVERPLNQGQVGLCLVARPLNQQVQTSLWLSPLKMGWCLQFFFLSHPKSGCLTEREEHGQEIEVGQMCFRKERALGLEASAAL